MDAHEKALLLRQRIIDLYALANNPLRNNPETIPTRAELDEAESALDQHLTKYQSQLAHRIEWRADYQILGDK